jgi:hypothetical protein
MQNAEQSGSSGITALDHTGENGAHPESKHKDGWDRFSALSTFLSTVVLGAIGVWFTNSYNRAETSRKVAADAQEGELKLHDSKMLEMQTVEKFLPHLVRGTEKEKRAALLTMSTLADPSLAAKLGVLLGISEGVDVIMAKGASKDQTQNPTGPTGAGTSGWVYLGHYVANNAHWETKYFNFDESASPDSLVGRRLIPPTKTGNVNVRQDMPTPEGDFPRVISVLRTDTPVTVGEVREWDTTGYMWAKVTY